MLVGIKLFPVSAVEEERLPGKQVNSNLQVSAGSGGGNIAPWEWPPSCLPTRGLVMLCVTSTPSQHLHSYKAGQGQCGVWLYQQSPGRRMDEQSSYVMSHEWVMIPRLEMAWVPT